MEVATEILIMLFLLMLALTCSHVLKKSKHQYLQEAGLVTLVGVAAGGLLNITGVSDQTKGLTS